MSRKNLNLYLLYLFIVISCLVYKGFSGFTFVFLVWLSLLVYSLNSLAKRVMLFSFLIAFFIFLLGRDFVQEFFYYKVENFPDYIQNHTYISLSISLISLGISYCFLFSRKKNRKIDMNHYIKKYYSLYKIVTIFFFGILFISFISQFSIVMYVIRNSYLQYYIGYSEYLSKNSLLYFFSKIELMLPIVFCILLATLPTKKKLKLPIILYIIYLVVSLGTGQRSKFILGLLFLFVYFQKRQIYSIKGIWIKKKYLRNTVLLMPVLMIFFTLYSSKRVGGSVQDTQFIQLLMKFFYDQGVSVNVIKRGLEYQNKIPEYLYTLEFLKSGWIARLLNIKVYHGNTIEHAMLGGSYTHTLGYLVLQKQYLLGMGTGSSYIAELFQDFGYIGVCIGNIFYAYLISSIDKLTSTYHNVAITVIKLVMIQPLIWGIRASFSGFLTLLLAPTTIGICFIIYICKVFISIVLREKRYGET